MGRFTVKLKNAASFDAAFCFTMPKTFQAHYDGTQIVLDEAVDLPIGARLQVMVLTSDVDEEWSKKWQNALMDVSGEEPEFSLREFQPETQTIQVWRLITHHQDRDAALRWSLNNGRIAIGWGQVGELSIHKFGSETEIVDAILHQYQSGDHPLNNSKSGGFSLWNLLAKMKNGDLVILRGASLSRVVQITGDYFFDALNTPIAGDFYNHQRRVEVTTLDADKIWQRAGRMAKDGGSIYRTLIRCENRLSPTEL
jgi:hypothetical protein